MTEVDLHIRSRTRASCMWQVALEAICTRLVGIQLSLEDRAAFDPNALMSQLQDLATVIQVRCAHHIRIVSCICAHYIR